MTETQFDAHIETAPLLGTSYREIVDTLAQGVVIYNSQSQIIYANQSAAHILGLSHREMLGHRMSELISLVDEEDNPLEDRDFPNISTLETGIPIHMKTLGVYMPAADRRWIILHSKRLSFDDGSTGVTSSFIDITDYRKTNLAANLLVALNSSVVHTRDEDALLQNMCDVVVRVGGYRLAAVFFANNDDERSVRLACASGLSDYIYDGMLSWSDNVSKGLGPAGIALRTGEAQVANDLQSHPGFEPWRDRAKSFGFGSSISLVFKIGAESALLSVYARDKFAFDDVTVKFLKEIAAEFGLGVAHVRSIQQLGRSLDGTMAALSRLSESRDPYTSGHETRVAELGAAIAGMLGLDKGTVDLVRMSGQVHDIGKVSVPIEILTRPGELNDLEFGLIKNHTLVGSDILSQSSLPWPIAEVALQHHERLDGSGYPNGLRGNSIGLPARIIAVADVVEAMSQHRPYRPARGLSETLDYVRGNSGSLFDSEVVEACLGLFRTGFSFRSGTWTVEG